MPEPPRWLSTADTRSLELPEVQGLGPDEVARFWLSDAAARSLLNEQLAQLLRTLLEPENEVAEPLFLHCPLCAGPLSEAEWDEVWLRRLRCPRGHCWASRGGQLRGIDNQHHISLHSGLSASAVRQLITYWLKPDRYLEPQLHESLRELLSQWLAAGGAV